MRNGCILAAACGVATGQAQAVPQADKESVRKDVDRLPVQRSPRGSDAHVEGLRATETLLERELIAMGFAPRLQEVKWAVPRQPREGEAPPPPWHNVIVEKPGIDAELQREVLIVGAHFDAVPASPGADDNGSGVAALLHVARTIAPLRLKRSVRLVFFNLEEVGLVGSRVYAESVKAEFVRSREKDAPPPRGTLIGMVSLESIGFYSSEEGSQQSPVPPIKGIFEPPTKGDFLSICTVAAHQPFSRRLAREMTAAAPECKTFLADFFPIPIPDIMRSDHGPFLMQGLPAVMLTDTANFRNPNYHKETDTIETLDLERLAHAANAVAGAVIAIAEEEKQDAGK